MRRPCLVLLSATAMAATALVAFGLAMMGTALPANAVDPYLCPINYDSIQDTIDHADDGYTVRVPYGTYYENLVITEDITLQGGWSSKCTTRLYVDPAQTIIDGGAAGSVVSVTVDSAATLDCLTLTNGQSDYGGGVYVYGASPTLTNMVVTGNVITPTETGGTDLAWGGGIYVEDGTITLNQCDITYNTAYATNPDRAHGGGLALYGTYGSEGRAVLEGTRIMSNTNPSNSDLLGAGLYLYPFAQVTFEGTENLIAYNEGRAGGGVYMYGNVDLEGVRILDNSAPWGGGIYLSSGWDGGRIANNYLVHNEASVQAASIFAMVSSVEIANNTIVGNFSGTTAGIEVNGAGTGPLELTNNIVVSHTVGIKKGTGASLALSHNDVWGNTTDYDGLSAGSGDISADPEFVDPDNDDYALTADSPCVNAGVYVDGLFFDFEGDRRTGALPDIGADEYGSDYTSFAPAALKSYSQ